MLRSSWRDALHGMALGATLAGGSAAAAAPTPAPSAAPTRPPPSAHAEARAEARAAVRIIEAPIAAVLPSPVQSAQTVRLPDGRLVWTAPAPSERTPAAPAAQPVLLVFN